MDHATAGDNLEALERPRAQRFGAEPHLAGAAAPQARSPGPVRPGYVFTMTVAFSADTLARELAGVRNYDW